MSDLTGGVCIIKDYEEVTDEKIIAKVKELADEMDLGGLGGGIYFDDLEKDNEWFRSLGVHGVNLYGGGFKLFRGEIIYRNDDCRASRDFYDGFFEDVPAGKLIITVTK